MLNKFYDLDENDTEGFSLVKMIFERGMQEATEAACDPWMASLAAWSANDYGRALEIVTKPYTITSEDPKKVIFRGDASSSSTHFSGMSVGLAEYRKTLLQTIPIRRMAQEASMAAAPSLIPGFDAGGSTDPPEVAAKKKKYLAIIRMNIPQSMLDYQIISAYVQRSMPLFALQRWLIKRQESVENEDSLFLGDALSRALIALNPSYANLLPSRNLKKFLRSMSNRVSLLQSETVQYGKHQGANFLPRAGTAAEHYRDLLHGVDEEDVPDFLPGFLRGFLEITGNPAKELQEMVSREHLKRASSHDEAHFWRMLQLVEAPLLDANAAAWPLPVIYIALHSMTTTHEAVDPDLMDAILNLSIVLANTKELGGIIHSETFLVTKLVGLKFFGSTISELTLVKILNSSETLAS